ncbi:MAG TPA: trigger factor [Steroidobacteraceae bacterium]|jgi:trigger factor|nr:trigger factor [Steroidobacteraceae bacterium]
MMVSVQSTGALERRMEVAVPASQVEKEVDARLKNVSRTARLKGFRPGKAPLKVIRQQFGSQIHREVISDLLQSSFAEAVSERKLNPAGGPRIEPISVGEGEDLKYTAIFEVFPEVTVKGMDSISLERPVASVNDEDIDAMIESLRKQRPNWTTATRNSRTGDRITIDFAGTIGGVAFDGGKGENVTIVLGEGRMLPEFEAGLIGRDADSTATINVRFPDDYHSKDLAGKTAEFAVTVKKVEEPELPALDEEFSKAYGVSEGGVAKLREEVGDNMRRELEQNVRARMKSLVLDKLLAANPVELPAALVESQVRDMQIDTARRMGVRDAAQIPAREPFVEPARRRVALGLLINEIIKTEKIELDRAKVASRLEELVTSYKDPQEALRLYRENREAMQQVEMLVLEDQVVDWLLGRVKVTDQPSSFKAVMNFGN